MDNTKNVVNLIFFIIILILFAVGGYFFMNYMLDDFANKTNDTNQITELKEIRIDPTKDYIYFANHEDILEEEHIEKQDVIINIKGFENINTTLSEELASYDNQMVSITDAEIPEGEVCSNGANLYSFPYREYQDTVFGSYISLVINDFTYYCTSGNRIENIKSYVIDKNTGEIYTPNNLLEKFGVTEEEILTQIRKRLNDTQVLDEGIQVIDIDGTINDIQNGEYGTIKALSISKTGELVINFIVKSNVINYNDSIELN